ncbi:hypothetical protein AOQ84DRAFT_376859 [Glonium stellatum]|uniref:Transcription factor domain-containing protein n=1 Tax=Glonium stellatum TaxID=574774 RepID=A0A8E2JT22_9PEZI|nr:hypothetical protein AOQ84DRAFT_376859 [Glonium stellatum]
MDAFGDHVPKIESRSIWGFQKIFVKNFLQWLPLLAVGDLISHVKVAQTTNFASVNASSSLSMFIFAFAEISEDNGSSRPDLHRMQFLPGLEYYQHGSKLLRQLPARGRRTIEALQCRILNVSYLQCAILPILTWDAIMEVGRDCMHILSSGYYKNMEKEERESFHRIFWISSIIIHELESVLKMHPTGIRQFHEIVPLPLTETEVEGFYYFFAQASLRKLLMETLGVVGYRVGQVIYAPVVAAELRKQAQEWYDHLPPPVRFPINTTPLFDLRKSFLRIQFVALHTVILWPSVLQLIEAIATRGENQVLTDQLRNMQKEARDCIEYCILNCELAEELVMQRHQGLQFTI